MTGAMWRCTSNAPFRNRCQQSAEIPFEELPTSRKMPGAASRARLARERLGKRHGEQRCSRLPAVGDVDHGAHKVQTKWQDESESATTGRDIHDEAMDATMR